MNRYIKTFKILLIVILLTSAVLALALYLYSRYYFDVRWGNIGLSNETGGAVQFQGYFYNTSDGQDPVFRRFDVELEDHSILLEGLSLHDFAHGTAFFIEPVVNGKRLKCGSVIYKKSGQTTTMLSFIKHEKTVRCQATSPK